MNLSKKNKRQLVFLGFLLSNFFALIGQSDPLKVILEKLQSNYNTQNYDSAIIYSDRLIQAGEKERSDHYLARGYYHRALTFVNTNRSKEGTDDFYKALKLCTDTSDKRLKANIYNNLGVLNYNQKNLSTAKAYFKSEIQIKEELTDQASLANNYINLSAVHRALKENDSSALILQKAKAIVFKIKDPKPKAYYYHALGVHYQSLFRKDSVKYWLDSAAVNYKKTLSTWLDMGNKEEALRPLFNLGLVYHFKKEYNKALTNYLIAKDITDDEKLVKEKITVLGNLAELYYDLKNHKQAADYFRRYIELKDSLRQSEIDGYALKLDKQFHTEKEIADYALKLDKQYQTVKNKETIKQQELEIAEQTARIEQQSKRIYLALFLIVIVFGVLILIVIRFNFEKRLNIKIEEAKKKFFSNVVHEIRTPLSMIQAPLKVLKTKINTPDEIYNIELAERNIQRLNELVNQMLDISKIDSVKYRLNETYGDIELFFKHILITYTKIAVEKNISVLHQFNIQNKVAFFDKDALEKITGNLLNNAVKYTPNNNQVGIDVYTEDTEQGVKLTISVWDTGVGIAEKDQDKIFNRFYRAEKTAVNIKGVGIGLALVKDLVELQKGSILLKSKEGKGSTFTITLTLKTSEETIGTKTISQKSEDAYQILIVEDDLDILEFNAKYIEKNNFNVLKARNGKEALELIEKTLPDLIITDLMMPELDGIGLLKNLKNNPESDHIPVIILSAKASPESRMEALKFGAQGYLTKPYLPEELISLVSNQLEVLSKKKTEFKQLIDQPEKKAEEKFVGDEPYTQKLFALIFKHLEDSELSVEKLADMMATNRSHFQRKVKAITGLSPSEIIKAIRLEKAKELLLAKSGNITEVAYQTGFSSQSYFTKCFTQHFGLSPSQMLQTTK